MNRFQCIFTLLLCVMNVYQVHALTWTTDFSELSSGTFSNGASISTGSLPLYAKATNTDMIITASTSSILLTDNSSSTGVTGGIYMSSSDFSALGSTGLLSGSFEFAPLSVTSGTRGQIVFAISSALSIGSGVSAIQITINNDYSIGYFAGTTYTTAKNGANTIYLSADANYTLTWWEDYTSSSQDSYGFTVYDSQGSALFNSGTLSTRAVNITPSYMLLLAGTETGTSSSPNPFLQIESVSIANVIPEPSTYPLLFGGILALLATHIFAQKTSQKFSYSFAEETVRRESQ